MPRKLTYEEVKNRFEAEGCTLLSTEYKNNHTKLDYICICGNKSKITINDFSCGKRCGCLLGQNKRKTNQEVEEIFNKNGFILLDENYKNNKTKLNCICSCGNQCKMTLTGVLLGHKCKKCGHKRAGEKRKYTIQQVKKYLEEKNCTILSKEYIDCKQKIEYICSCGNIASRTFDKIKNRGVFCRNCQKKKLSKAGGLKVQNVCFYDTYEKHISFIEEIRRAPDNTEILEVKCNYCGSFFKPTYRQMWNRIAAMNGRGGDGNKFYCSEECKHACPVFKRSKYPKGLNPSKPRPGQSEFREMVLERDNYTCQICGHHDPCGEFLVAHHVDPVACNPIESMDVDNGVTLCNDCHQHAHNLPGCSTSELRAASC